MALTLGAMLVHSGAPVVSGIMETVWRAVTLEPKEWTRKLSSALSVWDLRKGFNASGSQSLICKMGVFTVKISCLLAAQHYFLSFPNSSLISFGELPPHHVQSQMDMSRCPALP